MAINRAKQKTLGGNPNAVATKIGWVDAERGELLVSIRGLPGAVDWDRRSNTFTKKGKAFDPLKKEKAVKATPTEKVKVAEVVEKIVEKEKKEKKPSTKKATKKKADQSKAE